ncbi:MAG TPA: T9SS type A sorting domain-containing protein [Candidatus Kapabacteria bacterium]|nr:T9SS type A sorting domain-containing protein [Candidatus Kapabacteria bacterium]
MKILLIYLTFVLFTSEIFGQQVVWVGDTVASADFGQVTFMPPSCGNGEWGAFSISDKDDINFKLSNGCAAICCLCTPQTSGVHSNVITATSTYNWGSRDSCAGKQWNIGPIHVSYLAITDSFMDVFVEHPSPYQEHAPGHYMEDNFRYDSISRTYRSKHNFTFVFVNNVDDSTTFSFPTLVEFAAKQFHFIFDTVGEPPFLLSPLVRRRYRSGHIVSDTMPPFTSRIPGQFKTFARLQNKLADTLIEINGNFIFDTVKPLSVHPTASERTVLTVSPHASKLTFNYILDEATIVSLLILDITGRIIDRICTNKFYQPGPYSVDYIPHMPSGQYFLSLSTKDGTKVVSFSYVR